ncbi:Phosphotransferase enzyme family protein [Parafrankia irregularis]|uniref:Phosphotransferase enzyme family protein n=1 Tax=Parafrankia irregularis TaxID=795642 RepID=A0A0S4QWD5_9ACTN|nr:MULTISPECIES: phosphotransferase [Parafrankia]MBE3201885.1 phosphotransferase [Parafrankia sp. CH37]CUU59529.1 Phosphotransferase enzyme family protein [Parafrankia irregularis]
MSTGHTERARPRATPRTVDAGELTRPGGEVLTDRKGRHVVRHGDIVVKTHMAEEAAGPLLARLRLAADPRLAPLFLPPLRLGTGDGEDGGRGIQGGLLATIDGRLVTAWPAATALGLAEVERDVEAAPWEAAAELLARLHATDLAALHPLTVPPAAVCTRLRRVMDHMETGLSNPTTTTGEGPARPVAAEILRLAEDVRGAHAALPPWLRQAPSRPGGRVALIHGDWHLGQVVRAPREPHSTATTTDQCWRIIDIDDLGWGDPAWDLARPAAWFAAGVLPVAVWSRFVDAYRGAGGVGLGSDPDPWAAVDGPARAVTVQYAAGAITDHLLRGTPFDEGARAFLDCARRLASGT